MPVSFTSEDLRRLSGLKNLGSGVGLKFLGLSPEELNSLREVTNLRSLVVGVVDGVDEKEELQTFWMLIQTA